MINQLKRIGADSLLYAFMNVGTKLIAFIMLPIYTMYLTPAEYGALDLIDRMTSMLTFLIIFGTDSALAYYYFETKDAKKRLEHVRNVLYFRLSVVVVLFLLVVLFDQAIAGFLFEDMVYLPMLYLAMTVLLLDSLVVVILMVMRFDFKTKRVVIFTVAKMFLIALISYLFLVYVAQDPEVVLYGRIISVAIVLVMLLFMSYQYLVPKINWSSMKEMLKYATPLVPASIAFWVIASSSSLFIQYFGTQSEVGIYGAATKLATIITLVTSGVQLAWRPYSMSIKDKPDSPVLFSKVYYILLLIGTFGLLVIATIMPWLIGILGEEYESAYQYVALVSAATFLNFFYLIISVGLFFKKKTGVISATFGIVALVNLALNFALIPPFGIWGAVISYLASYMAAITFIFSKSQKYYHVPVSYIKMVIIFLTTIAGIVWILLIQTGDMPAVNMLLAWAAWIVVLLLTRMDKAILRS
ncbi:lipopolysaccharide biosynthesis protein [Jeotgalibacillus sp. R-1-5s-1]|uniref:lipopolysaccharide biosynthesis protein n=1 Tax=Jeotgalibacillus sp. R-1-5s-1 TaxID=2555897 RepID=UPI00106CD7D8|nr:oligosaccharide flippase family protein [Jeotgalibacillus sp. R-1-5s-1]TFD95756.1 polysaccharide biosynthesis protein [Jeotgalibacillus sp. R-1-5s-1]